MVEKIKYLISKFINSLPIGQRYRKLIFSILIALGLVGGMTVVTSDPTTVSGVIQDIWPYYTDRLYSFDGNLAWLSLTGDGDLQAQNDDMWIGRDDSISSSYYDGSGTGVVSHTVTDGQCAIIGRSGFAAGPDVVCGYWESYADTLLHGNVVLGGVETAPNIVTGYGYSVILGGTGNETTGQYSSVGGGSNNVITDGSSHTIFGGQNNEITSINTFDIGSIVAGGGSNVIERDNGVGGHNAIIGGNQNTISNSLASVIVGTEENTIVGYDEGLIIGSDAQVINTVYGTHKYNGAVINCSNDCSVVDSYNSTIIGGTDSDISGANWAFASGRRAKVNHNGAFVFSDSSNADFSSDRADQFKVRASGGAKFNQDGTTAARSVLELDQDDIDESFINYIGTSAADASRSISTMNGDGVVDGPRNAAAATGWTFEGMVRIEINGVEYWMPFYSVDTP